MRIRDFLTVSFLGLAALAALPAKAGPVVIYDNDFGGVTSGDNKNIDAWTVNFGFIVANSFTLGSSTTLTGINLLMWEYPGDSLTSIDYSIYDNTGVSGTPPSSGSPLSGNQLYTGTLSGANLTDTFQELNGDGYNVDLINLLLPGAGDNLASGTYWLVLQNAVTSQSNPVFWDQSDGPSYYWENSYGYASGAYGDNGGCDGSTSPSMTCSYSESFQLLAGSSGVPEPSTLVLLGGGLLALGAIRIKKS